jgi:hypothetical protein
MIVSLKIGSNSASVPSVARANIERRAAQSRNPDVIKKFFSQQSAQLSMMEFETIYQCNLKEFIYLAMINDFDSGELCQWIDSYKYPRSLPTIMAPKTYFLTVIDEVADNKEPLFSVEAKIALNQASGIDVASAFLTNGYCFTKQVIRRDAKVSKNYYKHIQTISKLSKGESIVKSLKKLLQENTSDKIRRLHAKIALKISHHFAILEESSAVFNQVMENHFKRRSVDQLKAFLSSEKPIASMVQFF